MITLMMVYDWRWWHIVIDVTIILSGTLSVPSKVLSPPSRLASVRNHHLTAPLFRRIWPLKIINERHTWVHVHKISLQYIHGGQMGNNLVFLAPMVKPDDWHIYASRGISDLTHWTGRWNYLYCHLWNVVPVITLFLVQHGTVINLGHMPRTTM